MGYAGLYATATALEDSTATISGCEMYSRGATEVLVLRAMLGVRSALGRGMLACPWVPIRCEVRGSAT